MNKRIILGIIWCIIALALSSLLLEGLVSNSKGNFWNKFAVIHLLEDDNKNLRNGMNNQKSEEEIFQETVNEIELDVKSETVEVVKTSEKKIRIEYVNEAEKYTESKIIGKKLSIKQTKRIPSFLFILRSPKIILHVPSGKLDDVNLFTSSGTIRIDDMEADNFTVKSSSGTIKVENITAKTADISASSGTINADDVSFDSANVVASSGTIKISGKLLQANVKCSSGTIKVENEVKFEKDSSFTNSSGTIKLHLVPSDEYYFETNATTGSIRNELESNRFGNVTIKVKTTSGSININKN